MEQTSLSAILAGQTERALWEVKNVIDCIPQDSWTKKYCGMPLWKHGYHMLHSLDRWFLNPRDPGFQEPPFHEPGLNDLDLESQKELSREEINAYYEQVKHKIEEYLRTLRDEALLEKPECCEYARFTLMLAQHRHLHTHMGMLMGFIVAETGLWPRVVGLEQNIPQGDYEKFF